MLLPLEYSMTLWWVATPQWGTEPDPDALTQVADVIDTIGAIGAIAAITAVDPIETRDETVRDKPPVAPPLSPAPARMRRVLIGYTWSAEPHWAQVQGPLYEGFVANQRHDAERHRSERARFIPAAEPRQADGAVRDRAGLASGSTRTNGAPVRSFGPITWLAR